MPIIFHVKLCEKVISGHLVLCVGAALPKKPLCNL